jgi:phosphoribosyl-ATP pyrophosphohydrolase/phosphoribosyl-AMP cyclohydrolase/histidinol dehydrogenase
MPNANAILRRLEAADVTGSPAAVIPPEVCEGAARIVEEVRLGGDAALRRLAAHHDGWTDDRPLLYDRRALEAALSSCAPDVQALLLRVAGRIRAFAEAQRRALDDLSLAVPGGSAGHRVTALAAAGCYAPGGRHPLPSSVLMTAVTARAAGVATVVVACPRPEPVVLAAAAAAGADCLLAAGGAQAIGALAWGTESVPACEAVVGPGNIWVTAAKRAVEGRVRTDGAAGPSELVVVADAGAEPAIVAADLLAQAEHDPLARPVLVALDDGVIEAVEAELEKQLATLPTAAVARPALAGGYAVRAASPAEAVALCNLLAPEHLQWNAADSRATDGLTAFGGLFLGAGAAEVLGDYGAGPNHVLPTGGAARLRGGLWVGDFLAVRTWLRIDDLAAAATLVADARALARLEGLEGHARAADRRLAIGETGSAAR